jgi:Fe-S oxidoreductase
MKNDFHHIRQYESILHKCLRCGLCKTAEKDGSFLPGCPAGTKFGFEAYYASGKPRMAKGLITGEIKLSPSMADAIYSCCNCAACKERCIYDYSQYTILLSEALRAEAVEAGIVPKTIANALENTYKHGNPWGRSSGERSNWAKDLKLDTLGKNKSVDVLYFVGCTASFDPRVQEVARSLVTIFRKAGVNFSILGNEEKCCGSEMLTTGEKGLFEMLRDQNIETFKKYGVRKIVTSCPHGYNTFTNNYPKGEIEVQHHTQFILELLEKGKLKLSRRIDKRVTYHDPCYLGRYNKIFEPPRKLLEAIPGLRLIEMPRNRKNSLCCGGGGGRIWIDETVKDRPSKIRANEVENVNANVVATACPFCLIELEDGIKIIDKEGSIQTKDIAELVKEAI